MRAHVLQILLCYVSGIVAGSLIFAPLYGPVVIVLGVGGVFLGLPELVLVILVFVLFHRSILRHLLPWCLAAPFLITTAWLAIDWNVLLSRAPNAYTYWASRGTWDRAALAFTSASFASALFWYFQSAAAPEVSG
jgi:hypothetical protein